MLISSITQLIESYGLVVVAVLICLESIALPVPGETVLILAAVFAGTHHQLHIVAVVLTAATAAFVGQVIGYMIGRQFGYRLLLKYGGYLHITEGRIKLGEYLFLRYGVAIVIVARFVPVLRSIIGILAGANRMPDVPFPVCQHCRCADVDLGCWVLVLYLWKSDPSSGPLDRYCYRRSRCDRHRRRGQLPAATRGAAYSGS